MPKTKLATIQLNSSDEIESNLEQCHHWIKQAYKQGAKLVALPENFAYMGRESDKVQNLALIQKKAQNFLSKVAIEFQIFVLGGGYPSISPDPEKAYNRASIFSPEGIEVFQYNKIHLFDTNPGDGIHYKESRTVLSGSAIPNTIDIPEIGRVSSVICYDLRFPELFRKISEQNVQIIFVPSAFTELTGGAHWEVLLRARAIENFVYIVAPGQTGTHTLSDSATETRNDGRLSQASTLKKTYGHSMVISPWGEILLDAGEEVGCNLVEIDLDDVEIARKKIPALDHRFLR